jgi:hypothetical protein
MPFSSINVYKLGAKVRFIGQTAKFLSCLCNFLHPCIVKWARNPLKREEYEKIIVCSDGWLPAFVFVV